MNEQDSKKEPENSRVDSYNKLMDLCPILYGYRKKPMTLSCMCFGIECGEGWLEPISTLSKMLEALNILVGSRYGLAIRAKQVKEKFGTLRFYYDVEDYHAFDIRNVLAYPFRLLAKAVTPVNVSVGQGGSKMRTRAFKLELGPDGGLSSPSTRRFAVYRWANKVASRILSMNLSGRKRSREREAIANALDNIADRLVRMAEDESYCFCETCGTRIGDIFDRCQTLGWILYKCERCAEKGESRYIYTKNNAGEPIDGKDGKVFYKGKECTGPHEHVLDS